MEWIEPPAPSGLRNKYRAALAELRENPGQWAKVGSGARSSVYYGVKHRWSVSNPDIEVRIVTTDGVSELFARAVAS